MGQCKEWCDKTLVTLCASLVGMSRRHALMTTGCQLVLSHHSEPDSLVKQVFANIVWKMFALVISQSQRALLSKLFVFIHCICDLSWRCAHLHFLFYLNMSLYIFCAFVYFCISIFFCISTLYFYILYFYIVFVYVFFCISILYLWHHRKVVHSFSSLWSEKCRN